MRSISLYGMPLIWMRVDIRLLCTVTKSTIYLPMPFLCCIYNPELVVVACIPMSLSLSNVKPAVFAGVNITFTCQTEDNKAHRRE